LNFRRFPEQFCGLGHQRGGNFSAQVSFAAGFVIKNIKNPKPGSSMRMADQAIVPGSSSTRDKAPFRKFSTSVSFPGLASNFRRKLCFCHEALPSFGFSIGRFVLDAGRSGLDSLAAERMNRAAWSMISGLLDSSIVFEH
jgi:hypothetical protein